MEKLLTIINSFARDDFNHLQNALVFINSPLSLFLPGNIGPVFYRPISQQLYFWLNYNLFGLNPLFYHLANIFFHILTGIIIYYLFKKFNSKITSFYIALVWTTSPINLFSVFWICGFSMVGAMFFIVLTFTFYVRGKKPLSLLFFILALCSNEITVFLVPTMFFYSYYIEKLSFNECFKRVSFFAYILAIYLGFYYGLKRSQTGEYVPGVHLISNIKVFIKYFLYPFSAGYRRGNNFDLFNIFLILRFVFLISSFWISIPKLKNNRKFRNNVLFFILWFLMPTLCLSLVSNHVFSYMNTFGSLGLIALFVYVSVSQFKSFFFRKSVVVIFVIIQLLVLCVSFLNDSDINWLYKYSAGNKLYTRQIKKSYDVKTMSFEEREYTFYGKMYDVYNFKKN